MILAAVAFTFTVSSCGNKKASTEAEPQACEQSCTKADSAACCKADSTKCCEADSAKACTKKEGCKEECPDKK